jgi:hypothetical protein
MSSTAVPAPLEPNGCWIDTDVVEQAQALVAGLDHQCEPLDLGSETASSVFAGGEHQ